MTKILVLGDLHGNLSHLIKAAKMAKRKGADRIVQVGDFGVVWDKSDTAQNASNVMAQFGLELWFLDGNHENFDRLKELGADPDGDVDVEIAPHVHYLPRGFTWVWDDVRFMSLGGAFSVDIEPDLSCYPPWRGRQLGVGYWKEETITYRQVDKAVAAGKVDVLLTHDSPEIPSKLESLMVSGGYMEDHSPKLDRASRSNRLAVSAVMEAVQPKLLIHGHHHVRYNDQMGETTIVGLNRDKKGWESWEVLDLEILDDLIAEITPKT